MEENDNEQVARDWWYELPDAVKANIQAGIDDVKAGRVMSSEEFWRRVKEIDKK